MMRTRLHEEKGVILPLVLILTLILMITGFVFVSLGVQENSLVRKEIAKRQAFYLAEAGVEGARVQLGQDWYGCTSIDTTPLGAGTYTAHIYTTDSNGYPLLGTKRRVTSTGTVVGISKTVQVIVRKPPDGSEIDSAITSGGNINVQGSADIDPPPTEDDENFNFELGNDPDDDLSLFEEIFGVTKDEMKDIAQSFPNNYYDSAIGVAPYNDPFVENITWVHGGGVQSQIQGNWTGSGILIVDGDLKITGNAFFDGIIWVTGSLEVASGTPEINGAIFVESGTTVDVTGNLALTFNVGAIDDALSGLGAMPIVEFWEEL